MKNNTITDALKVKVTKKGERFTRVKNPNGPDSAVAEFFLLVDITPTSSTIYIPLSIASGKKPTGFVYQIEGTKQATIMGADISCKGSGVTQIALGTLRYAKIPKGTKATFRIHVEVAAFMHHTYHITLNRINYKHDPSDARYKHYDEGIESGTLILD
ncbi:MAG: hypothetical protein RLZZ234_339 [Candidatus Parcubacteria bacterium]|jgi:hypothetical protein